MRNVIIIAILAVAILYYINKTKVKQVTQTKLNSKNMTKDEFIKFLSPSVKLIAAKTGIPYAFMMAQIALETGWGKSELFWKYNNVGGIRSFHPERETSVLEWTHEDIKTSDLGKYPTRDKSKDVAKPNGITNISIQLPFRTFKDLVTGLQYYLDGVLLNKHFKGYIVQANGDPNKYVELLQSGKIDGAKYATGTNYVPSIKSLIKQFA